MTHRSLVLQPLVRALVAAAWLAVVAGPAAADERDDRIQALEKRLADLERRLGAAPAPAPAAAPAAAPASAPDVARLQDSVTQLSESVSKLGGDTGLPVHGFADIVAAWSGGADPAPLRGFNAGTLDLYLTPQFGQRVKSLIEIALEYDHEGALAVDMERLQLGYTVSDGLTLWAGRFHTPFGLWNTSFHHGANLQTSVFRPRFVDFEDKGGILPAHSVGLWASGRADIPGGRLGYDLFVANGPSIRDRTIDFNATTDDNANKMLGLNLAWRPRGALAGLTLGLHGFGSDVAAYDASGARTSLTRLRMGGAYFGYDGDDWEALGEAYRFANADAAGGGPRHRSTAWFVQLGRSFEQLTPFVRLERAALDAADPYFASQASGRSYQRAALGLRYALDPRASFKLELSRTREDGTILLDESGAPLPLEAAAYRRAALQYSVSF